MRNKKISVLGLTIIIFLSLSNSALADSGVNYKVKAGDSHSYKIIKDFNIHSTKPTSFEQTYQDGTKGNITIQEGLAFSVSICYVVGSGIDAKVYIKSIINGKTSSCAYSATSSSYPHSFELYGSLEGLLSPFTIPVIPVTDNSSYYQNFIPQENTVGYYPSNSVYLTTLSMHGNNILERITGNESKCFVKLCFRGSYVPIHLNTEINIDAQTGWYTNITATQSFVNGTIYSQYKVNENTTTSSNGLPGFEISSILLSFMVAVPIILIKRRRN